MAMTPGAMSRLLPLDHEDADRALLTVAESVVHERKLARHVAHELEYHTTARRRAERLHASEGSQRRCAKIDGVELLADDVEMTRVRRPRVHEPESHALAHLHTDRLLHVLARPAVER